MSRRICVIEPRGWPVELQSCPPGLFMCHDELGFKSEYKNEPPYVVATGEIFVGGTSNDMDRALLLVQPCEVRWKVVP